MAGPILHVECSMFHVSIDFEKDIICPFKKNQMWCSKRSAIITNKSYDG